MILRPSGVLIDGEIRLGLEIEVEDGVIQRVSFSRGLPDGTLIAPAFVNAHSHLEYRCFQDRIVEADYFSWIKRLTELKTGQTKKAVRADCRRASLENQISGVGVIGEHSDRPGAASAMALRGMQGTIYFELITFLEQECPEAKREAWQRRFSTESAKFSGRCGIAPHAPYTVDAETLKWSASLGLTVSIHVAETALERKLFAERSGPLADLYHRFGFELPAESKSSVSYLDSLGILNDRTQVVHGCDVDDVDIEVMKSAGVSVAHCPRSNERLGCPISPVRRLLEAGIPVGLGLDSAASSGKIDMFEEMRSALYSSRRLGEYLEPQQILNMATTLGAQSLGIENHRIEAGSSVSMIRIQGEFGNEEELIEKGSVEAIEWI